MSKAKSCLHNKTTIVNLPIGSFHKAKTICTDCSKFISWSSLKSPTQRAQDRKQAIKDYYLKHPEKDKFKSIYNEGCLFSDDEAVGVV
jgi:hypothetical protein